MSSINNKANCSANYIVISMIPILFFIAMILGYLGIIPIKVPIHALILIGFILFIFLFFIKHNANYTICKMKASYPLLESDLQSELLTQSLTLNGENRSILDIGKYLNTYYSDARNDNFVSVASSVFPMLGILGTFIAIAISMPNFSVTETEALDNEITILLSGVGSAFFASIYGILLSLIWTYFEKSGLSKIDIYFSNIKTAFEHNIWSKDELLIYKYSQYENKDDEFINQLKEVFDLSFIKTINEQNITNYKNINEQNIANNKAINEQNMASFNNAMNEANTSFTKITKHMENVSSDLKGTLSQIDSSQDAIDAKNQIEKTLINFTIATNSFEKTTKVFSAQLNSSLNRTFEKIDNEVGDIVVKLADFATHVSLESREVQNSIRKYHQLVASQAQSR